MTSQPVVIDRACGHWRVWRFRGIHDLYRWVVALRALRCGRCR